MPTIEGRLSENVKVWNKSSINVLPVGVVSLRASGKRDLLVGAFEGDVEPSKESMDIWRNSYINLGKCTSDIMYNLQSLRLHVSENGALNVRSSFFAVSRLMC